MAIDSDPAFGDLLRRARRQAGFTQEALAERAGISVRAITDLERGVNRSPRRDTLEMLAEALDLEPDERSNWERLRSRRSVRGDREADAGAQQPPVFTGPTNFPAQPTQFFGREDEVQHLTNTVSANETRLVTLIGPGGSGKTRLAIEVALGLAGQFPDGVFFVDLASVTDADLVPPTIGTILGVRPRGNQLVSDTLAEWIGAKRLLLLLDNFEQVLDAAPEIGQLLSRCESLQILVTSRAPLHLRAEREYPILPLPLPPLDDAEPDTVIAGYDVVRLFVDRARAVRPGYDATGDETVTVARICRHLDGLPLAVELAAACIRLFPPTTILQRLSRQLPLPASGQRDAPARQQTLHDTIAWSYDLLQPDQRALLRRLSIFKGGWTIESAEAVAGDDAGQDDVLGDMAALVEHSLIQPHEGMDGSPRFSMLETIREFGQAQLAERGETDSVHGRLAAYLLQVFSNSESDWHSPRELSTLRRADAEIENLRLALDWSLAHDPGTALRLARELSWYWFVRGFIPEAQRWLEHALAGATNVPDGLRAYSISWVGSCATTLGDFQRAELAQEQALAIFQRLEDEAGIALCLHNIARNAMWSGDLERAETLYEEVVDTFRNLDLPRLPTVLENLGGVLSAREKFDRAALVLDEALAQTERHNLVWDRAAILDAQATLAIEARDLPRARQFLKTSVLLHRDAKDPRNIVQALEKCAWFAIADGAIEHAARLLGAAGKLRHETGTPVPPLNQPQYDRYLPIAQAEISPAAWERAMAAGRALSQSGAIELALQGLEQSAAGSRAT